MIREGRIAFAPNNGIAISNKNNAPQYIGEFGVIGKIYERNERTGI